MLHIDDTGAKLNRQRCYTFCISNKYFTQYDTRLEKNRWAAVGSLLGEEQRFLINQEAIEFIAKKLKKPKVTVFFSLLKNVESFSREYLESLFEGNLFDDVTNKQRDIVGQLLR
jgi:hypothetical protein